MSEGWKDGVWEPFKCPICGSIEYVPVIVRRPSGTRYPTQFNECFGCSVMFTDPVSFCGSRVRQENPVQSPDGGFYREQIKRAARKRDPERDS